MHILARMPKGPKQAKNGQERPRTEKDRPREEPHGPKVKIRASRDQGHRERSLTGIKDKERSLTELKTKERSLTALMYREEPHGVKDGEGASRC